MPWWHGTRHSSIHCFFPLSFPVAGIQGREEKESEFEGFCSSAEVTVGKGEGRGKVPKLFCQSTARKQPGAPHQRVLSAWDRREVMCANNKEITCANNDGILRKICIS